MSGSPAIRIDHLSFRYPNGVEALRNISLSIEPGEKVAFIGPNGAGKSTLLLHLNGVRRGRGELRILGRELNDKNLREIRAQVGLVFQDPDDQLFCPSVFDDVAFGPLNHRYPEVELRGRVERALRRVGMEGSEEKSPFELSGGEKRRIALATVLSLDPEILVLDEPSSMLDPKGRRQIIRLLKSFRTTLIIATHDLDLVLDLCDRVVVLHRGLLVRDGPAAEILRNKDLLEEFDLELPLSISG